MMSAAAILVFALGAAAEVPHWVQEKPLSSFKVPSFASMITPMLSMHGQQTPNNRRLQAAMVSKECTAACPGVPALVKALTTPAGAGRRLDAHGAQAAKVMCDNMDAVKCMAATKACQDTEEQAQSYVMLECMCTCPKLATIGEDMSKVCKDKPGTIGCVTSTSACAAVAKTMNKKEVDLMCDYSSKGCEAKMTNLMTCAGDDMKVWGEKGCQGAISADNAESCCPIVKKLLVCIDIECNTITMAVQKMKADAGSAEDKKEVEKSEKARQACPDAGIPSAAAVSATASKGTVSSGDSAAGFAAPGQTVSMLAMAAVIAASLMA